MKSVADARGSIGPDDRWDEVRDHPADCPCRRCREENEEDYEFADWGGL